jgi:hypothetical protein
MSSVRSRILIVAGALVGTVFAGIGPAFAGLPVPAPLVGVTGPAGIVAAGVAYGGYLLYKRFRH